MNKAGDFKSDLEVANCDLKDLWSFGGYLNPICLPDEGGSSVSFFNSSNTTLKYLSCVESFLMTAANLRLSSSFVSSICLSLTNARMMAMFTSIACSLLSTVDSIATPCSVKARGRWRRPPCPVLEVANCNLKSDLEIANCDLKLRFEVTNCDLKDSASFFVSRNMKSSGNRFPLRVTRSLRRLVVTP